MATVFVAGGIAIQALGKRAEQVRDLPGTFAVMMALAVATAYMVRNDPDAGAHGSVRPATVCLGTC